MRMLVTLGLAALGLVNSGGRLQAADLLLKNVEVYDGAGAIGHATLREQVMGKDLYRASTPQDLSKMKTLLAKELQAGAFGLSTGLEYEEGHFATTEEVVELAKVAAASGGFYLSHVRDEANNTFESFDEVLRIGREASRAIIRVGC